MNERATHICDYVLQGGLLSTVLVAPAYFNIDDQRIFEPDKAILLRDLAAVLAAIWLLRQALRALAALRGRAAQPRSVVASLGYGHGVGHALRRWPTLLPMLLLTTTTLLTTATSLLPAISWNGSYARGQGALTTLAYLTIALLVLDAVRQAAQARRRGAAIALCGLVPAAYGWVQHFGRDPLPWQQADLAQRVPGTLGNPIFLGALLVMTLPLAL